MNDGKLITSGSIYNIVNPPNPWERISEVAARLGVAPCEPGRTVATITAKGADGKSYDVWEVVIAFLDRMDK